MSKLYRLSSNLFHTGDRVSVINDAITGTVKTIDGDRITIVSDEGFDMVFQSNELVLEPETWLEHKHMTGFWSKKKVDQDSKPKKAPVKRSKSGTQPMIVDLHIEKLVRNPSKMAKWELLDFQINSAKNQLDWALSKRKERIIFIHGIGEGVLKAELETLLRRYDNIRFYPANASEFGAGAIEVYRLQNP